MKKSLSHVPTLPRSYAPTLLRSSLLVLLAAFLAKTPAVSAATFTSDTLIGLNNTNFDGQDIIVTNCTLTIDGEHAFASVRVLSGGVITHTFSAGGYLQNRSHVSNELHSLSSTNPATLNQPNIDSLSVVVTDLSGTILYVAGTDYLLGSINNGNLQVIRTSASSIPDGATISVSYDVFLTPAVSTGVRLTVTNNFEIEAGGFVTAAGRGFGAGFGPGAGATASTTSPYNFSAGSGGGFGGYGGASSTRAPGGNGYGSIPDPTTSSASGGLTDKGSGGGAGSGPGGLGGGAIRLAVGGILRVDGQITADGAPATNAHSGGGAGGAIWLSAQTFFGTGNISANGGSGEPNDGGGGGGGRIAIYYTTNNFSGNLAAHGGAGATYGGAGTIYQKPTAKTAQLYVDNAGFRGTNTLISLLDNYALTVSGGAVANFSGIATVASSLILRSNGVITHISPQTSLQLTVAGDATIESGSGIIADGKGSLGGQGSGPGSTLSLTGGGGGHGGYGGSSISNAVGGTSYGTAIQPLSSGSGGGAGAGSSPNNLGGSGGGAIRLLVNGTLSLDGNISADGAPGTAQGSGGGSGGSIWLTVGKLLGSGSIRAQGGAGETPYGGGGGGGRLALYYGSNQFNGRISASGGPGAKGGGAGTIYAVATSATAGQLTVDNQGMVGTNTPLEITGGFDLTVSGGAILASAPSTLRNLAIGSNSWVLGLAGRQLAITVSSNVVIGRGGGFLMDGLGYSGGSGPGLGGTLNSGLFGTTGGGGGYGGSGGASAGGAPGGNSYGSVNVPPEVGSGGGAGSGSITSGGAGGGSLRLTVTGSLSLDGMITANGLPGIGQWSGGGAGGTVWLTVGGKFSGAGLVAANGGAGDAPYGGGGGGGRIAIQYGTNDFVGTISARGGSGATYGGAGTIWSRTNVSFAKVLVDNGGVIGAYTPIPNLEASDLNIVAGGRVYLSSSQQAMRSLFIGTNSSLSYTSTYVSRTLTITSNATIQAGGGIVLDGQSTTLGGGGPGLASTGSGGGYGGYGGNSLTNRGGGIAYGAVLSPLSLGSPGGSGLSSSPGGAGGGALHLTVNGTLTLDGRISAEGLNASPGFGSGGGSGGSLWLTAGNLLGTGVISVNGGAGDLPTGGGGGGGRIEIEYNTNLFTGTTSARGGAGANYGGAGTVCLVLSKISGVGAPFVQVDNGGIRATNTMVIVPSYQFDLTISGGAAAAIGSPSTIGNLLIRSNSWLTYTSYPFASLQLTLTVQSNATIQAGGGITLDGLGFGRGYGFASGVGGTVNQNGGGGGHGGYGGAAVSNAAPGGIAYDSPISPTLAGSGGGGLGFDQTIYYPGAGGGTLRLIVPGTLQLDGKISADGIYNTYGSGGGGAGGSLYLSVGKLAGAGLISANGGAGVAQRGGGGGGGRIAIYYNSNQFAGPIMALGGTGATYGGAGTVFLQASNSRSSQLIVDNGGALGTNTLLAISDFTVNVTLQNGARAVASNAVLGNLVINSNASLTYPFFNPYPQNTGVTLTLSAQNAIIESGGAIILDRRGYGGGQGPGTGASDRFSLGTAGGGAGHAGYGGRSAGGVGGNAYGLLSGPSASGSGGGIGTGFSTNNVGGSGGGVLRLTVVSNLTLNGTISSDGGAGIGQWSGGGAGGSLWLTVGGFSGNGVLSANGGAGDAPYGGGGGGGRVALFYTTNQFTGSIVARGGAGTNFGGAGTIYLKASGNPFAHIVADNGGTRSTNTPVLLSGTLVDISVSGGAVVNPTLDSLPPIVGGVHNLLIASNGWLSHAGGSPLGMRLGVSGDATILAGGGITADAIGYTNGVGSGAGGSGISNAFGGGGYGGYGGSAIGNARGGTAYGSISQPLDLGSGGGALVQNIIRNTSGAGGGHVQLSVLGTLTLNGKISADGGNAPADGGGGGSGGSVLLSVGQLLGSGLISANGGAGDSNQGGGGGGGRIALYYKTNNFSGPVWAHGGPGYIAGGAGTVFLAQSNAVPQLVVENGGISGTNTPLSSEAQPVNLSVRAGAILNPSVPLILNNVSVESGGTLTHLSTQTNVDLTILGNALVASDAAISVNAQGYSGFNGGPGAGQMTNGASGSGAGYGGLGGASASGAPGGPVYGSASEPVDRGSRGGLVTPTSFTNFSQGGGAIWMKVAGTLTVNGKITANGNDAIYDRSGGGSGGSIWISSRKFDGSGFITANGGAGEPFEGGGGGGGRVAIYSRTNNFSGPIVAFGGSGWTFGGMGTVIVTNLPGPRVIAQSPSGFVSYAVDHVDLTFSSPLNLSTISAADFFVDTPNGSLPQNVLSAAASSLTTVRLLLPRQDSIGYYEIQAGPQIEDFYGLPMSADYIGSFVIFPPTISGRVTDTNGIGIQYVTIRPSSNLVATVTDANGAYTLEVPPSWNGSISALRGSALFVPSLRTYSNVSMDLTNQNFTLLSPAALVMSAQQEGSNVALRWYGLGGVTYQSLYSTDLVNWLPYGTPFVLPSNGPVLVLVPMTNSPLGFFRFKASY